MIIAIISLINNFNSFESYNIVVLYYVFICLEFWNNIFIRMWKANKSF